MISVGVDVHVRNSYFRAKDDAGATVLRGRCGNTPGEFAEFLAPLERRALARAEPVRAAWALLRKRGAPIVGLQQVKRRPGGRRCATVGCSSWPLFMDTAGAAIVTLPPAAVQPAARPCEVRLHRGGGATGCRVRR
jgi:hypothetical protein